VDYRGKRTDHAELVEHEPTKGPGPHGKDLSQYITSHLGQLSLAIPPWVGTTSTNHRAVMLCGWVVKAGMAREGVRGKIV